MPSSSFLAAHTLSFPADSPCSNLLGMLSGLIPDSQISASSIRGYDWSPSMARLVSSRSGWFPRIPQAQPGEEWLQVDLGVPKNVKGVIIQGARGGDSVTTTESRSFVKKFKVAYSMNGKDWEFIQDPKTMQAKVSTAWSSCKKVICFWLSSVCLMMSLKISFCFVCSYFGNLSCHCERLHPLVLLLSYMRGCRFHLVREIVASLLTTDQAWGCGQYFLLFPASAGQSQQDNVSNFV